MLRRKRFHIDSKVCEESLNSKVFITCKPDPIKLAYNPCLLSGRLKLTASAFKRQYSMPEVLAAGATSEMTYIVLGGALNSTHSLTPGRREHYCAELTVSSPAVDETIASTHCTYPRRDGQAEWAWKIR